MKTLHYPRFLSFLFVFSYTLSLQSQSNLTDFLNQNFIGGRPAFLNLMFQNIKYPEAAKENQIIGKLSAQVSISKEGIITDVNIEPTLGFGLEEEIDRTIRLSNNQWKESTDTRSFVVTFGFKTNLQPNVQGDILVMTFVSPKPKTDAEGQSLSAQEQFKIAKQLFKDGEYAKSENLANQLLLKDPVSKKYQQLLAKIRAKSK